MLDLQCRNRVGDLYLVIHVIQKKGIRREGLHLYSDVKIDYSQAILGTVIKVTCDLRSVNVIYALFNINKLNIASHE